MRKLRRQSAHLAKDPPILIVRPHKQEGDTCEATSQAMASTTAADRIRGRKAKILSRNALKGAATVPSPNPSRMCA